MLHAREILTATVSGSTRTLARRKLASSWNRRVDSGKRVEEGSSKGIEVGSGRRRTIDNGGIDKLRKAYATKGLKGSANMASRVGT